MVLCSHAECCLLAPCLSATRRATPLPSGSHRCSGHVWSVRAAAPPHPYLVMPILRCRALSYYWALLFRAWGRVPELGRHSCGGPRPALGSLGGPPPLLVHPRRQSGGPARVGGATGERCPPMAGFFLGYARRGITAAWRLTAAASARACLAGSWRFSFLVAPRSRKTAPAHPLRSPVGRPQPLFYPACYALSCVY